MNDDFQIIGKIPVLRDKLKILVIARVKINLQLYRNLMGIIYNIIGYI
jgi:hypothetical protein